MNIFYLILLFVLLWRTAAAGVIAPRGEETGRDLMVGVPNDLSNKGNLSFCDLVPY